MLGKEVGPQIGMCGSHGLLVLQTGEPSDEVEGGIHRGAFQELAGDGIGLRWGGGNDGKGGLWEVTQFRKNRDMVFQDVGVFPADKSVGARVPIFGDASGENLAWVILFIVEG